MGKLFVFISERNVSLLFDRYDWPSNLIVSEGKHNVNYKTGRREVAMDICGSVRTYLAARTILSSSSFISPCWPQGDPDASIATPLCWSFVASTHHLNDAWCESVWWCQSCFRVTSMTRGTESPSCSKRRKRSVIRICERWTDVGQTTYLRFLRQQLQACIGRDR